MSLAPISVIMTRIKAATPESPIAVFKPVIRDYGQLDAMFGSTVRTQERVESGDPLFVGYFHSRNGMSTDALFALLKVATNG